MVLIPSRLKPWLVKSDAKWKIYFYIVEGASDSEALFCLTKPTSFSMVIFKIIIKNKNNTK